VFVRLYGGPLSVFRVLLNVFMALLSVFKALLSVDFEIDSILYCSFE